MRALTAREFVAATRSAAVPIAGLVCLATSAAFILSWSPGVPLLAPMNLYAQTRALQWLVLALVLPWAIVRSSPMDHGDSIELMAALGRTGSGSAVWAKVLGSSGVAIVVILAGLPGLVLAQQAVAMPAGSVVTDLLSFTGLAVLVAATATGAMLFARDALRAWLLASGIVSGVMIAIVALRPQVPQVGLLCGDRKSVV